MKIALYGKLRAGKSAVCDYIIDKFDDVKKIEFSDGLQEVVDILYPEQKGIKDREKLIDIGQHMRKYDVDVWVNVVKHRILNSDAEHILVAGVRQQNEYDMLKELGFTFISVDANEETRIKRCLEAGDKFNVESLKNHTEMVMDNWKSDYIIINEYGFKELEISIRNVIDDILKQDLKVGFFKKGLRDFNERTGTEE